MPLPLLVLASGRLGPEVPQGGPFAPAGHGQVADEMR
jgi:hypothetical protein